MSAAEEGENGREAREVLAAARDCLQRGYAVVPVPFKTKKPVLSGWQHLRLTEADLPRHFGPGRMNIGLLTGEPSGGLVDVDCDTPEAARVALDFLPPTPMVHGHGDVAHARSKPRSHFWYVASPSSGDMAVATKKYQFVEAYEKKATMLVELRGAGCQTIVPPSTHPCGETLYWDRIGTPDGEERRGRDIPIPARVESSALERAVAKVAASALLARHWPWPGSRDDAALALCGMLMRAGWPDDEINHFVRVTAEAAGDEQYRERGKARHTREQLAAGKSVTGIPRLAALLRDGERVVPRVRDWLALPAAHQQRVEQSVRPPKMPSDAKAPIDAHRAGIGSLEHEGHLNAVNLATVEPEAVRWLWAGYIPLGKVTVIDGDPGLGKSLLTLDLAARVTTAAVMPDGTPGSAVGAVILLSAEDDLADTIRPRLDAAGADVSKVVALEAVGDVVDGESGEIHERPLFLPQDIGHVRHAIAAHGACLVVIDPLMAYLDGDVNAHRDQDIRRALRPLAQCAQETGAAIVVVRHLNKAPGAKAIYRGGGSIGIAGAARSVLLVAEDPHDDERRVLARVKSNLAAPVPALAYRLVESAVGVVRVEWLGASEHTATTLLAVPGTEGDSERPATAECVAWLEELLDEHDGAIAAKDAQREARAAGFSDKVLRLARLRVCERPMKEGFGGTGQWLWHRRLQPATATLAPAPPVIKMPSDAKAPIDAHRAGIGSLEHEGHLSGGEESPAAVRPGRACLRCGAWLAARADGGYVPCPHCTPPPPPPPPTPPPAPAPPADAEAATEDAAAAFRRRHTGYHHTVS